MRILFIGGTLRGYRTLKALVEGGWNVAGVLSLRQDEHEVERCEKPIQELADGRGIPHVLTKWLKDRDSFVSWIRNEVRPDIGIAVGCRILIPEEIYTLPEMGTLAVHDSLLPEYRGFAPLNWSILNGEQKTGVSLFYLNGSTDCGDIVAQKQAPIAPDATAPEVYEQICDATVDVILEACPLLAAGTAPRVAQDPRAGSYTCSRMPSDGEIDWTRSTQEIFNLVRALTWPYPGAYTFAGGRKLFVWRAKPLEDAPRYAGRIPGRVVGVSKATGEADVLTGDGILRLSEVQHPGEEKKGAAEVIRSVKMSLGLRVPDLLARLEALESRER